MDDFIALCAGTRCPPAPPSVGPGCECMPPDDERITIPGTVRTVAGVRRTSLRMSVAQGSPETRTVLLAIVNSRSLTSFRIPSRPRARWNGCRTISSAAEEERGVDVEELHRVAKGRTRRGPPLRHTRELELPSPVVMANCLTVSPDDADFHVGNPVPPTSDYAAHNRFSGSRAPGLEEASLREPPPEE